MTEREEKGSSIIYALISRGEVVLSENTAFGLTGNFAVVSRVLLQKISSETDAKMSYKYEQYTFHYEVQSGLTYLCMTDQDFPRVMAFQFIDELKKKFIAQYGERANYAIALAFNADFQGVMQTCMDKYNNQKDDKIQKVKAELGKAKEVVMDNIEKVLQRGEKIELLVNKTEDLQDRAYSFRSQSRQLSTAMWWKNAKVTVILVVIVLFIVYIILSIACGGLALPSCT
eukprot:TRINITY_DN4155_c0_g1_i1.p1 TRINITY_DN4155_c0_g1~~TRINITY_DN4155_c0_g1_i1.p1  ORF type:complete len:267 (+),score=51.57 TRINITY_DN4155_c0_g1_i1:116-802(+)